MADGNDGLRIIDISDPTQPVETGYFITGDYAYDVAIANGSVYLSDYRDGLYIFRYSGLFQQHFTPVWTGNPYQPMAILVKSAAIYGTSLKKNDEIGVFVKDSLGNEICVGEGRVTAPITKGSPLNITVSTDDPTTPQLDGFKDGDTIYYKLWDSGKQIVFSNVDAVYDKAYDLVFNALGTAVVSLSWHGHYKTVWSGNPFRPMNILIDSIILPDSGSISDVEVGIFDKNKAGNDICVGAGIVAGTVSAKNVLSIVASSDDPGTTIMDGFIKGHKIFYKVWSSGTQKEHNRFITRYAPGLDSLFTPLGTALVSISFPGNFMQKISLSAGWNMISYNVVPDTLNMLSLLRPLISNSRLIKVIDEKGGFIQNIPGVGWMNTVGNMANTEGYYVKVSAKDTLHATGKPVILPFEIPLQNGWNMMGYPLQKGQDAKTALQSLIDSSHLIKVISEAGGFIQNIPGVGWMNTIGNFVPGEGYYIKVTGNTHLILNKPAKEAPVSDITFPGKLVLSSRYFNKAFSGNPYYPMNILVTNIHLAGYTVRPGDEIAAFDNGICVGTGVVPENTTAPVNIVTSLNDPTTTQTDGYTPGDLITLRYMSPKLDSPIRVTLNTLSGSSLFTPLGTTVFGIAASPDAINEHFKSQSFVLHIYPNPAKGVATFEINNVGKAHVRMEILNLSGKVVDVLCNRLLFNEKFPIRYNTALLPPGVYDVRVIRQAENKVSVKNYKLVITR